MKNTIKIILIIAVVIALVCSIAFLITKTKGTKSEDYDAISNVITDINDGEKIEDTGFMELWETNVIGTLEIPSINVKLSVADGIDDNTLSKYVGHFPSTSLITGNVGMAGHNTSSFFADLKKLKVGDEIIYTFLTGKRTYNVETIVQINEMDWSYLDSTEDNRLTLITCIKGNSEIRLCIQATEKNNKF